MDYAIVWFFMCFIAVMIIEDALHCCVCIALGTMLYLLVVSEMIVLIR